MVALQICLHALVGAFPFGVCASSKESLPTLYTPRECRRRWPRVQNAKHREDLPTSIDGPGRFFSPGPETSSPVGGRLELSLLLPRPILKQCPLPFLVYLKTFDAHTMLSQYRRLLMKPPFSLPSSLFPLHLTEEEARRAYRKRESQALFMQFTEIQDSERHLQTSVW